MKKLFILLVVVIAVGVMFWVSGKDKNQAFIKPIVHPYAIEALMSHVALGGKATIEKEVVGQNNFRSYIVSYYSDNLKLYALMNIPKGTIPEGGWPVVVVNHGHIPPKLYVITMDYKNTAAYFANQGFLVLKPDYRGHDKSQGKISELYSRNQYAVDVLNLIEATKSIKEADSKRIFVYGHSMGGDVSLQVAEVSTEIKGVVLWAPAVTTYPEDMTYFVKNKRVGITDTPGFEKSMADLVGQYGAKQMSSLSNVDKVRVPVVIQHSTTDQSVPFVWGKQLSEELKKYNKEVTFYEYPGDNHDIAGHWVEALNVDVAFFKSI